MGDGREGSMLVWTTFGGGLWLSGMINGSVLAIKQCVGYQLNRDVPDLCRWAGPWDDEVSPQRSCQVASMPRAVYSAPQPPPVKPGESDLRVHLRCKILN